MLAVDDDCTAISESRACTKIKRSIYKRLRPVDFAEHSLEFFSEHYFIIADSLSASSTARHSQVLTPVVKTPRHIVLRHVFQTACAEMAMTQRICDAIDARLGRLVMSRCVKWGPDDCGDESLVCARIQLFKNDGIDHEVYGCRGTCCNSSRWEVDCDALQTIVPQASSDEALLVAITHLQAFVVGIPLRPFVKFTGSDGCAYGMLPVGHETLQCASAVMSRIEMFLGTTSRDIDSAKVRILASLRAVYGFVCAHAKCEIEASPGNKDMIMRNVVMTRARLCDLINKVGL